MSLFDSKAVITGIGQSELGRNLQRSGLALTAEACLRAISDAGLEPSDIDGVASYPSALNRDPGVAGAGVAEVIDALGLSVNWYVGAAETSGQLGPVMDACMAVATCRARHVICFRTVTESSAQRGGGRRSVLVQEVRSRHWSEWTLPFGVRAPSLLALGAQRYMYEYGLTREQLAQIPLNNRRNAVRNPNAVFRDPLTLDDYLSSRMISTPLCLFDCDVPMDGSTAVVVSRADATAGLPRAPIVVESVGAAIHGRIALDQMDYLSTPVHDCGSTMWESTRLTPGDVDVAQIYDGFSFLSILWLEALGFCEVGKVGEFIDGGHRIALDGELPITTSGGQLSAGRLHGMGFLHEACVQLWGEGGDRQVAGEPTVTVAAAGGGNFAGCMLLRVPG